MKFSDLYDKVKQQSPKQLNVINPLSDSVFQALKGAADKGYIHPNLFGNKNIIKEKVAEFKIPNVNIYAANDPNEAAQLAVKDISEGKGQLLMKGDISTSGFMKPVLNKEWGLRKGQILSHIAVASGDFYHKLLFVADGGINIDLNYETRKAITQNTVEFAEYVLGTKPTIAFAAVIEDLNEKLPETIDARALALDYQDKGYLAEGPIAFDVIFSKNAAMKKGIESKISENTDLILFPNMSSANFAIKQMIFFNSAHIGGIIAGATVPLILLSRSDSAETKLNSILLALL